MSVALSSSTYEAIRARLFDLGHGDDHSWSQGVRPPESPEALACEYTWVVLNSGMKNTVARVIMDRVWPRLVRTGRIGDAFRHPGKVAGIESVWTWRDVRFRQLRMVAPEGPARVVEWCESLPWIGKITKYHLAKNLGVDVAKPDRWLIRLADASSETVDGLCARLAAATGDRVATVDVVLWRACTVGVLEVTDGEIRRGPRW